LAKLCRNGAGADGICKPHGGAPWLEGSETAAMLDGASRADFALAWISTPYDSPNAFFVK
jgi:hypothetical protein